MLVAFLGLLKERKHIIRTIVFQKMLSDKIHAYRSGLLRNFSKSCGICQNAVLVA